MLAEPGAFSWGNMGPGSFGASSHRLTCTDSHGTQRGAGGGTSSGVILFTVSGGGQSQKMGRFPFDPPLRE